MLESVMPCQNMIIYLGHSVSKNSSHLCRISQPRQLLQLCRQRPYQPRDWGYNSSCQIHGIHPFQSARLAHRTTVKQGILWHIREIESTRPALPYDYTWWNLVPWGHWISLIKSKRLLLQIDNKVVQEFILINILYTKRFLRVYTVRSINVNMNF